MGRVFMAVMICCFMFQSLASSQILTERKTIIVAGDAHFPPYEFVDEVDGSKVYRGFNVDIVKAIALQTGYEIEFKPMTWSDALEALDKGEVDAIQGMKYNEDRALKYDFSDEYLLSSQAIFVLKGTHVISELNDLGGHKVAVEFGDIAYQKLKSNPRIELVSTKNQAEALQLLIDGKVSAVVGNRLTCQYTLQKNNLLDYVKIVGALIDPQRYGIAVRKGNRELLAVFNQGIRGIKQNETYDKIYAKWFGEEMDYPAGYYKRYLTAALTAMGVLGLIVIIFYRLNYLLKNEVKKRTHDIEKAHQELLKKDKMEALGNLVACVAHEIRNPLTAIKTFTELIPLKFDNPNFRNEISQHVPREIDRLNAIINDLLNYAHPRKSSGERIMLKELVDSTLVLFSERIKRSRIALSLAIEEEAAIFADKQQIKQVLINVILNGIQAVENRQDACMRITSSREGGQVTLTVADNGEGIAAEDVDRIFEPFFTTKNNGTGLGLFVSYRLVKENGGDIYIAGGEEGQTRLAMRFPCLPSEVIGNV